MQACPAGNSITNAIVFVKMAQPTAKLDACLAMLFLLSDLSIQANLGPKVVDFLATGRTTSPKLNHFLNNLPGASQFGPSQFGPLRASSDHKRASSDQIWSKLALGGRGLTLRASSDHVFLFANLRSADNQISCPTRVLQ